MAGCPVPTVLARLSGVDELLAVLDDDFVRAEADGTGCRSTWTLRRGASGG